MHMAQKKKQQLGVHPSTASGRLVKDILWKLIVQTGQERCHHCGLRMTRQTFSIEHKTPWLDSEDPAGLYFDLENVAFSHLRCNLERARKPNKKYADPRERKRQEWKRYWNRMSEEKKKMRRKSNYLKYGC